MNIVSSPIASWMDRLLGLSQLSWSDLGAHVGWAHPMPAWVWVAIVLGSGGISWWSYCRLLGALPVRIGLAGLRGVLIVLVALLLAGPQLVRPAEQVDPDCLIMLVDRSASLQITDSVDESGAAISRDEALRRALIKQRAVFGAEGLAQERQIVWLGFGGQVYEISPDALPEAGAHKTSVRTAIEESLQLAAGRPVSGIVLITDGRSPQPMSSALVRLLQQQAIGVFPVPLGAEQQPLDLAVARVDAPRQAFVNDIVPIQVTVERHDGTSSQQTGPIIVRLVDDLGKQILDQKTINSTDLGRPVRLTGLSSVIGEVTWRVEVESSEDRSELVKSNNSRSVSVEMVDHALRVLYIEGYPRWEYRYLKNLLVREQSIASSILLLSADRGFAQEGDQPVGRPPRDTEEIQPFDVIVIGDVPADYLTAAQAMLLRDHVALRGAGLLWIGGPDHMPRGYGGSPLAELLPMKRPTSVQHLSAMASGLIWPTPLAGRLSVLQLHGPDTSADQWPANLPPLHWAQDLGVLKPTADVLAENPIGERLPLVVRLRYGAGQSIYVATDETWRWRYGRGELYFEQFWIQLVRMLGRSRIQSSSADRARLVVSSRRLQIGQTVVVELEVTDAALLARPLTRVKIEVADPQQAAVDSFELYPAHPIGSSSDEQQHVYTARWRPTLAGRMELRVSEAAMDDLNLITDVEVVAPDDELRHPRPDHERLRLLAKQTDGQVIALDRLPMLIDAVPNRARKTATDIREPLWHSPLALALFLGTLTSEWIVRKLIRLV